MNHKKYENKQIKRNSTLHLYDHDHELPCDSIKME